MQSMANTNAGKEVGFRTMTTEEVNEPGLEGYIIHPGPGQVYLSRAPKDDLTSYRGDGDWFKIAYAGPEDDNNWRLYHRSTDVRHHTLSSPI